MKTLKGKIKKVIKDHEKKTGEHIKYVRYEKTKEIGFHKIYTETVTIEK